jgi:pSer/pThr/pTyr-binding forkhead associated (FHA) protein
MPGNSRLVLLGEDCQNPSASLPPFYLFTKEHTTIGRSRRADITMDSEKYPVTLSRLHVTLWREALGNSNYQWHVSDKNTLNGTFINCVKVQDSVINHGDLLTLGGGAGLELGERSDLLASDLVFRFEIAGETEVASTLTVNQLNVVETPSVPQLPSSPFVPLAAPICSTANETTTSLTTASISTIQIASLLPSSPSMDLDCIQVLPLATDILAISRNSDDSALLEWLRRIGFERYHQKFIEAGCFSLDVAVDIEKSDLLDLGMPPITAKSLMRHVEALKARMLSSSTGQIKVRGDELNNGETNNRRLVNGETKDDETKV